MVRPKKHLGQHFLQDHNIAGKIAGSIQRTDLPCLEIGPGKGILSKYLIKRQFPDLWLIEIDPEAVEYLKKEIPALNDRIIEADVLKADIRSYIPGDFVIAGNFPYNISSQIFFRVLENRGYVAEVAGMIQKEVAERLVSGPGSREYGILSVLLQAYYHVEYLFTVSEHVFYPRPKVKSAVIRLQRREDFRPDCEEDFFFRVVKTAFNQRRKTLRNALSSLIVPGTAASALFSKRAEQLGVDDFVELTRLLTTAP